MRIHILFSILLILIIKEYISEGRRTTTTYVFKVDLKKYEKVIVPSSEDHIIFDSSEFKKGEKIYFKITADKFYSKYILYKFFDDGEAMSNTDLDTYKKVKYSQTDKEYSDGEVVSQTSYYTIKKKTKIWVL